MDESYSNLSSSHLLGSVPAVISDEKKPTNAINHEPDYTATPEARMQIFPPNPGSSARGYQSISSPTEGFEQQPDNNWKGMFSIASYTQYFNVDTDVVVNRLMSSLYPTSGDFFNKIGPNPDLYGLVWITATLVFVLASLGNCAAYLIKKRADSSAPWVFDVNYVNLAALSIYVYATVVPLGFYFSLKYMGSNAADLVRFWCLWGYSLFIFVLAAFPLLIPVEFLRWVIILLAGTASSSFVALNLRSCLEGNDLTVVVAAAFALQMALAIFIKVWFFP